MPSESAMSFLYPVARACLAATFIISALRHLFNWSAALDEMAGFGMPRSMVLLIGSIALRLAGGLSVLAGFEARWGAVLLLLFVVPATFLGHAFWAKPAGERTHEFIEFLNNLSMTGGVLLVLIAGSGAVSVDAIN
jgi:putative oxidoreductase